MEKAFQTFVKAEAFEPEPEPELQLELEPELDFERASTAPAGDKPKIPSDALVRTATALGHERARAITVDISEQGQLTRAASAASSGPFTPRDDRTGLSIQKSKIYLQVMGERWDPKVEFITVQPAFLASWHEGKKDEDGGHREILDEDDLRILLERLGYRHDGDAEEGCSLKMDEAMGQIRSELNSPTAASDDLSQLQWNATDYKMWWLKQSEVVQREMQREYFYRAREKQAQTLVGEDEVAEFAEIDNGDEDAEADQQPGRGDEGSKAKISRVIDELGRDLGKDLDKVHKDLRENVGAFRTVDNIRIYSVNRGRGGVQRFQEWLEWFCAAPSRLVTWMQQPVELSDDTSAGDWWKIFMLQLLSHCFPPLLFWRGFRERVRKKYTDDAADKVALEQMKGLVWLQLFWWFVLVSLLFLRLYDYLPSFVNSEIGLNIILWASLALIRSEKEASRDMVPRDHTPTDLGTQFLGAVDQVTNDQDFEDAFKMSSVGFPKFVSLSSKIAQRRAANERLGVSEHRMHELKAELISNPQWDTFRPLDFRHEYEVSLEDVLSEGAEGTLREFFDEMVVCLMPYAAKEFRDEFRDFAEPRPGDPANKQTSTYNGWASTKDGRYTDCLIRMRQGDVGYLRSRPSSGEDFGRPESEDLDRAEKMDKRLRECEDRHKDIKQAQDLLALLNKHVVGRVDLGQHAYGRKTVILLALIAAFCLWLGDESDRTKLVGDEYVRHKLRSIKSDVLDSSGELVRPLGIGAELFTWIGTLILLVVMWMLWRLVLSSTVYTSITQHRCWMWATCRANKNPGEALTAKVEEFFCRCTVDSELSQLSSTETAPTSGRVEFTTDEESDLFPLAKHSSSSSTPFPAKHMWTSEQAKRYLIGHDRHIDDDVSFKQRLKSAKVSQEKTENDLNPPRDRCRNVLRLLNDIEAERTKRVKIYSHEKKIAGFDSGERARVEKEKLQEVIDEIVPSRNDAELLAVEFDAALSLDTSGLLPSKRPTEDAAAQARLMLATWIDLQMWCVHDEFTRHVESLKKECRNVGYISQVQTRRAQNSIPASLVARGIVGLSQAYAHKFATSSYFGRKLIWFFAALCAASPYLHYLLLGCKEYQFESLHLCAFSPPSGITSLVTSQDGSGSWEVGDFLDGTSPTNATAANVTDFLDPSQQCMELRPPFCEGVEFCAPRLEIRTCHPSSFEKFWHVVAGFVEISLVYTMFKDILVVLERFWMAQRQMEYFSQITPWPGMQSHLRFPHYGLLPTFKLSCPDNVRAWNKIRIYLCSFNKEIFGREQLVVSYAFALTMVATVIKIIGIFTGSVFRVADDDPEIVDTMAIKIIILQVLSGFFVGSILWTGMQTTRLQEHGLRHILMLSKAEHHAGTLFFSGTKNVTMLVPQYATIAYLQKQIERKLGIVVAHQRIDYSSAEDPRGGLVLRQKLHKEHEKARASLLKKKHALIDARNAVREYELQLQREHELPMPATDKLRKRDKQLTQLQNIVEEKRKTYGVEEQTQLAWLQDMQWRYDQKATPQELEKAWLSASQHFAEGGRMGTHPEEYEDESERYRWLSALRDEWREVKHDDSVAKLTLLSSPRLDSTSSHRFLSQGSGEIELGSPSTSGNYSSRSQRELTTDAECSIRICGLRAAKPSQQRRIEKELVGCFKTSQGSLLRSESVRFHRGSGGPFDSWATLTFHKKQDAERVLRHGLRGWSSKDERDACKWRFLPLETQERWGEWLCDPDPLTGSSGVLDVQRRTFSKSVSVRRGIKPCKPEHLQTDADNGARAEALLKYKVEVRDGQDIKLTKLKVEDSDRKQQLDDGVLVVEFNQSCTDGTQPASDHTTWSSWRDTSLHSTGVRYQGRRGSYGALSDISSTPSQHSEISSPSAWTEGSYGSYSSTSPTLANEPPSSLLERSPVLLLQPTASDSSTAVPIEWRRHGETSGRGSMGRETFDHSRQETWRQQEQLGYMLDALADVMEEERIPPNLRHLPTVEDIRPTIEVPYYGPVPLTGLLFSTTLSLLATGLGTTATAIYGSTLQHNGDAPG